VSPGLPREAAATLGLSHKIQPLTPEPREARVKTAATKSTHKTQPRFTHPQSNPLPKSTVDLGCEQLIWVEKNPIPAPFLKDRHAFCLITTRPSKNTNQIQTVTGQKIYPTFLLIQVEKIFLPHSRFSPLRLRLSLEFKPWFHPTKQPSIFNPTQPCANPGKPTQHPPPPCPFLAGKIKIPYSSRFFRSSPVKASSTKSSLVKYFLETNCDRRTMHSIFTFLT